MHKYNDFTELFSDIIKVDIDIALYKKIKAFRLGWAQKDQIYSEFLGSKLLGVHPIRFSTLDDTNFFTDVVEIDMSLTKEAIDKIPGVNSEYKVTSNVMFIVLIYLMHKFTTNKTMTKDMRDEAVLETYYVFAYKVMGSIISHYFKYDADEQIAMATYEKLSNRFIIKQEDNWQGVFTKRGQDLLPPGGLHYNRLITYSTTEALYVISDLQTRLRDLIKNMYSVFIEVKENNEKIHSTNILEETEEGVGIGEITSRPDKYITYIRSIIKSPNDFIIDDIVHLITSVVNNVNKTVLVQVLTYISEKVIIKDDSPDDVVNNVVLSTITYMKTKNIVHNYHDRLLEILIYMKGYYNSSSVKEPMVVNTKKYIVDIVKKVTHKNVSWQLTSTTIAVMLYIFARSLYKTKN